MSIQIRLTDQQTAFAPGETIRGEITWDLTAEMVLESDDSMVLDLAFESHGKGTTQREVFSTEEWPDSQGKGHRTFEIETPDWPWTFAGKLISLVWSLDAAIGDVETTLPITVSPSGKSIDLELFEVEPLSEKWESWRQNLVTRFPALGRISEVNK